MKSVLVASLLFLVLQSTVFAQTCRHDIIASTPTERFTILGDGTVADGATGLTWKVCNEGQSYNVTSGDCEGVATTYSWQGALHQAVAVNAAGFAGYDDWRLPNLKELASIVERQCIGPAANLEVFQATPSSFFWSASPSAKIVGRSLAVDFEHGTEQAHENSSFNDLVRLVRGGQ